jgi:hypothetical protein
MASVELRWHARARAMITPPSREQHVLPSFRSVREVMNSFFLSFSMNRFLGILLIVLLYACCRVCGCPSTHHSGSSRPSFDQAALQYSRIGSVVSIHVGITKVTNVEFTQ